MKVKLKKLADDVETPFYATEGAAGFDIAAHIDKPLKITPGERKFIPTGLSVELPLGFELQIRSRSGLSAKYGMLNACGIGTIDSDFRGEIMVCLLNSTQEDFVIEPKMRIAQGVIARYEQAEFDLVDELSETSRGTGAFGSTGVKTKLKNKVKTGVKNG